MTIEQKVGQLIVAYVTGDTVDTTADENVRRFGVATPAQAVRQLSLGGVLYFGWAGNVADPRQVAGLSNGLQRASDLPLTVAIDEETGSVSRVGGGLTQLPGAMALGATGEPQLTGAAYALVGTELKAMGINTDYAPVADVHLDPANPVIGVRAFGSDPAVVAEHVAAAVRGLQSAGVSATAKHFPGHGDTAVDSHVSLPVVRHTLTEWSELDAPPFQAALRAGADAVMTGHLSFPEFDATGDPASLSHPMTTGLLRQRLGFEGVIVTDSLRMAGVLGRYSEAEVAVRALEAGADVLLDPEHPVVVRDAVLEAVRTGRVSEERMDRSVERLLKLKHRRGLLAPLVDEAGVSATVRTPQHLARARQITEASLLLRDTIGLVPLPAGSLLVTGTGERAVQQLGDELRAGGRAVTAAAAADETVRATVDAAGRHDLVVVTIVDAWRTPGQQALVTALEQTGRPLILVALGAADEMLAFSDGHTWLVTSSSTEVSLSAAARVLIG